MVTVDALPCFKSSGYLIILALLFIIHSLTENKTISGLKNRFNNSIRGNAPCSDVVSHTMFDSWNVNGEVRCIEENQVINC